MEQVKIKLSVLGYEVAVLALETISDIDNAIVEQRVISRGVKKLSGWWTKQMVR